MVRMKHPEHGFAHAYDSAEQVRMEEVGWSVEVAPEVAETPAENDEGLVRVSGLTPAPARVKRPYHRKAAQ